MRTDAQRIAGVYLLTPDAIGVAYDRVLAVVAEAVAAGVSVVQYRNKVAARSERERQASRLVKLVRAAGALAIVNDWVELAQTLNADGVHLGRDDAAIAAARARLPNALLGVSCYGDLARAEAAVDAGADAIAFGSMYPSATKPAATRAPLALLGAARERWPERRVIAIGGIGRGNIGEVAAAGAHAAAVISAVFDAPDAAAATRELVHLFNEGQQRHEPQRAVV